MSVLSLLRVLHFLISVGPQSPFTLPFGSVSYLAVGGDKTFASTVYQLSSDLQQQQQISLSNQIMRLAATQDGQWLVVCYTNDSCSALNGSDLSITDRAVSNALPGIEASDKISVFTAHFNGGESFYTVIMLIVSIFVNMGLLVAQYQDHYRKVLFNQVVIENFMMVSTSLDMLTI